MIRPVDLQQVLSYSSIVEKIQQLKQQYPEIYQHYTAQQTNERILKRLKQVQDTKHTEGLTIQEEETADRRKKGEKRQDGIASDENENTEEGTVEGIDVIV